MWQEQIRVRCVELLQQMAVYNWWAGLVHWTSLEQHFGNLRSLVQHLEQLLHAVTIITSTIGARQALIEFPVTAQSEAVSYYTIHMLMRSAHIIHRQYNNVIMIRQDTICFQNAVVMLYAVQHFYVSPYLLPIKYIYLIQKMQFG